MDFMNLQSPQYVGYSTKRRAHLQKLLVKTMVITFYQSYAFIRQYCYVQYSNFTNCIKSKRKYSR